MPGSYIVAARRSANGRFLGTLAPLSATQIAAQVIAATLRDLNANPALIDEVVIGQVVQAGAGQSPARQAALAGGLPDTVTAITVNQVCGSGLRAVMTADRAIRSGDCEVVLAG